MTNIPLTSAVLPALISPAVALPTLVLLYKSSIAASTVVALDPEFVLSYVTSLDTTLTAYTPIEPAIINNHEKNEDNDIEMEDENRSSNNNESDENTSQDSGNEEKNKKGNINKNEIKKKKLNLNLNNGNKIKIEKKQKNEIYERCLTVNQLGNLNMYPDAKTIDDMDC